MHEKASCYAMIASKFGPCGTKQRFPIKVNCKVLKKTLLKFVQYSYLQSHYSSSLQQLRFGVSRRMRGTLKMPHAPHSSSHSRVFRSHLVDGLFNSKSL